MIAGLCESPLISPSGPVLARRCVRERSELISERIGLTNRIGAILRQILWCIR